MIESNTETTPVLRAVILAFYALEGHLVQNGSLQAGQLARTLRLVDTTDGARNRDAADILSQMADELDADHLGHGMQRLASVVESTVADND